jgi:hypothetical protein
MAAEREKMYECEVRRRRFGAVKLLGRNGKNGTVPYVEHKLATDAEFCPSGLLFKKATDGREPHPSVQPVE